MYRKISILQRVPDKKKFDKVKYLHLSMDAVGIVGKECTDFYTLPIENIDLDSSQVNHLMKKLIGCCIRTTYLFCTRNKYIATGCPKKNYTLFDFM